MRRLYRTLYRVGFTPWDSAEVPGPVRVAAGQTPGRAVDLGCGTGLQARHLAERGWAVTAVDFVASAVAAARRIDKDRRVTWRVGDVTDVSTVDTDGRLRHAVDLILDNGCLHGVADPDRPAWVATVNALAAPGATLLVRAAPRRRARGVGPRGLDGDELRRLIGDGWDEYPAESGWYRFRRP
jgi:SAM-dependent methyltransferase